jgi:phage repressor protein C with HTH and peptisase S24 domain
MSLGAIIRKRREELGLTQDRLKDLAAISKPYLSNIETGKAANPPSDAVLRRLEKHLGFARGELTRMAHIARTPADVRQEHELMAAENDHLRAVIKELLSKGPRTKLGRIDLDRLARKLSPRDEANGDSPVSIGAVVPVINHVAGGYPRHFAADGWPSGAADEYVRCPDLHDPHAFAARVVGDVMEPKYVEGDIVVFSPAASASGGDDCFVRFADGGQTTFKRYYRDGEDVIRLQPLNDRYPSETYRPDQITGIWPAVFRFERLRDS